MCSHFYDVTHTQEYPLKPIFIFIANNTIFHISTAQVEFFSVMTDDQRFSEIREAMAKGGGQSMCEILDQIENRGIKKGIQIGKDSMRAENDALRAENKAVMAENARMRALLDKYHIVIA